MAKFIQIKTSIFRVKDIQKIQFDDTNRKLVIVTVKSEYGSVENYYDFTDDHETYLFLQKNLISEMNGDNDR